MCSRAVTHRDLLSKDLPQGPEKGFSFTFFKFADRENKRAKVPRHHKMQPDNHEIA